MKRRYRSFLCMLMALCLLLQPFVPVLAAAESPSVSGAEAANAMEEFNKTYEEVMAIKPVDLGRVTSACVGATSGITNFGIWCKNTFTGSKDEYVDYIGQIEDANQQILDAQAQMTTIKEQFDAGNVDEAVAADPNKVAGEGLAAQSQAMATLRTTLNTAGTALQSVGSLIDTLSTVLTGISIVLKAIGVAFFPASPAIAAVTSVLDIAATATGIAGPLIESAGDALVETAQAADINDQVLIGNLEADVGEELANQAVDALIDKVGGDLIGEMAGYLDPKDVEGMTGTITKSWNPRSCYSTGIADGVQDLLGSKFLTEEGREVCEEFGEFVVEGIADHVEDKTGKPVILGPQDAVKELLHEHNGAVAEETRRQSVQQPGLSF